MGEELTERLVKIRFTLDPKDWEGLNSESLWAREMAPGEYQIRNSPFYIYGISAEDVVYAKEIDGTLDFISISKRGGHSTYRILLKEGENVESPQFIKHWQLLQRMGCTYEQAKSRWLAVDVPPETDIFATYRFLENGETAKVWTFEEAHCGHPVKDDNQSSSETHH